MIITRIELTLTGDTTRRGAFALLRDRFGTGFGFEQASFATYEPSGLVPSSTPGHVVSAG